MKEYVTIVTLSLGWYARKICLGRFNWNLSSRKATGLHQAQRKCWKGDPTCVIKMLSLYILLSTVIIRIIFSEKSAGANGEICWKHAWQRGCEYFRNFLFQLLIRFLSKDIVLNRRILSVFTKELCMCKKSAKYLVWKYIIGESTTDDLPGWALGKWILLGQVHIFFF